MSPCLSKRGWIATARHSEFTLVDDSHRVFRQLWDRFWKFFGCHRTISSPRSFAAFIFAQVTIFPKNSLKVDSIFSAKALVFHSHFPPKRLWSFHDFSTICQHFPRHFPAVFCGSPVHRCSPNRCRTTTWAEARAWERTPEPPKRARCVG